ncbi:hypothetical protein [Pseudobutyrivibrio sp.]|uniref:hypothetical protein n=1 Tax=Pseudobutyrivibrio sp. TaxID=2014367 RepID=UPI001DE23F8B|nr:hypothetical protein [Pseudobutyrivibrio sp.]MBE5910374.1 hypothetical protein [Pseudobutyrivibrio sp.]
MKDELFLNNKVVTGLINSIESNGADLVFDETPLTIQSKAIGTDCMMKLANDSSTMIDLTKDYRTFVCNALVPSMRGIQRNINCSAKSVSGGIDTNSAVSKTTTNVKYLVKKIVTNGAQVLSKSSLTDEELRKKYADYLTGDEAVDNEIIRLLKTYGEDLSGLYSSDFDWFNNWSDGDVDVEITKKALSRIAEKDIEYIDGHLSNKKCANAEARVETILMYIANGPGATEGNVFNSELMNELKGYMSSDSRALVYLNALAPLQRTDYDYDAGLACLDIKINGVGVVFTFENTENDGKAEILCFTDEDRTGRCIDYWEKENPGCFDHEYALLEGSTKEEQRQNLITLYCQATSSADVDFLDGLFKSDGKYEEVFDVDPSKLSSNVQLIAGNHLIALADDKYKSSGYEEYFTFINAALNSTQYGGWGNEEYIEFLAVGSSMAADAYVTSAWEVDLNDADAVSKLERKLDIANHNELVLFTICGYCDSLGCFDDGTEIKVTGTSADYGDFDFTNDDVIYLSYDSIKVTQTGHSGMINYGGDYTPTIETNTVKIDLKADRQGSAGANAICSTEIGNLNEKKEKAEQDLLLDSTIGIIGVFCEPAGKGLEITKDILEAAADGDMAGGAVDAAGENAGDLLGDVDKLANPAGVGSSLYSAIKDYNEKMEELEEQIEKYGKIQGACTFYSVEKYETNDDKEGYYVKLNDFDTIKLIRQWDDEGISALYVGDDHVDDIVEEYLKSYNNDKDGIVDKISGGLAGKYSNYDIKKACNTILYGANCESRTTYESLADIPTDLLAECFEELDGKANATHIETQIEVMLHI